MGMDVYGKKPTTEEGKYFRNNVWWWRPLARYVCEIAPQTAEKCRYWQSNDGDGLNAEDSADLARILETEVVSGRAASYEKRYASAQEMQADIVCDLCEGTGTRAPVPQRGAGDPKRGGTPRNKCHGEGYVRPTSTYYPFSVDNVKEFITFLRGCGGFEIC